MTGADRLRLIGLSQAIREMDTEIKALKLELASRMEIHRRIRRLEEKLEGMPLKIGAKKN